MLQETIIVDQQGTKLAFTDSGVPSGSRAYTTIFAVHGMAFNAGIYERVQTLAKTSNVRFVAITRRGYKGSTPYSEAELKVMNGGPEEEKSAFMVNRGVDILTFIDKFLTEKNVPLEPAKNGNPGGVAIIGWSMGNSETNAAIANFAALAPDAQARLAPLIHTLILHEPSRNILGHAAAAKNWVPWTLVDQTIPENAEMPFFAWWISSYFEHSDVHGRDHDKLEYHVPAFKRPPTVYSLAAADRLSVIESGTPAKTDIPYQIFFYGQFLNGYNALFSEETRKKLLPNMQVFFFGCEHTASYGASTTWMVQDHDKEHGGGFIKAKLIKGINHFSAWDEPEITLKVFQDCIDRTF